MALNTRASRPSFSRSCAFRSSCSEENACSWKGMPSASATRGPMRRAPEPYDSNSVTTGGLGCVRSWTMSDIGPPLVRLRGSGLGQAAFGVRRHRLHHVVVGSHRGVEAVQHSADRVGQRARRERHHPVGMHVVDADPDLGPGSAQVADPRPQRAGGARRASVRRRVRRGGRAGSGPGASGSRRRRSGRAGGASGGWRTGRAGLCGSCRAHPPAGRCAERPRSTTAASTGGSRRQPPPRPRSDDRAPNRRRPAASGRR